MATLMSTAMKPKLVLGMELSAEEVEIIKGWVQNPVRTDESHTEAQLREFFFNALSNPGVLFK